MTEVSKALKVVVDHQFRVHRHSPDDTLLAGGGGAEGVEGRRGGGERGGVAL